MTDEEIRRIRRLVVGELPPTVASPRPVDPRHEERFRRALAGPRRSAATASRATDSTEGASGVETSARARQEREATGSVRAGMPQSARTASTSATTATLSAPPTGIATATATATALRGARGLHLLLDDADADADLPEVNDISDRDSANEAASLAATPSPSVDRAPLQFVDVPVMPASAAALPADLPNDWAHGLADTVLNLCTGSDPNFHSWTIQVPIDSAALPHTELRMTFSRHHLLLRFSTQSTQSYALISAHQSQLHRLLSRDLPGDRHIDIELT